MSGNTERLRTALAGRYAIEREIGSGGMAQVFLARDLRHDRHVALKLLDPELGAVLGVERFLAEIRVTANLQHPNLLPLFDSGEVDGQLFYVMPFVEGESLRARLEREKQLPVDEAIRIALGIANALDYAHAHDVIHRDLKPDNILLQHGEPVIADFGIALAVSRAGGSRVTQTGISLGTPQYMSPEQATGDRAIDGRSDIYSLGAVLYEMLGGEAPHTGSTGQAIIAKLMTEEPRRLLTLRRNVPAHIAAAVHRSLEKLPADRFRSAREFADALRGTQSAESAASALDMARRLPPPAMLATAGILGLAMGVGVMLARRPAPVVMPTLRFQFVTTDSQRFMSTTPAIPFSISPDDRSVVYVGAGAQGARRLYVRGLDDMQTRALPGSDGAPLSPTFSPDGKSIAFVLNGRIVKTPAAGGQVLTILPLEGLANAGLSWVDPDTIVASIGGRLVAVPVNGGTPVPISTPDTTSGVVLHWGPRVVNRRYVAYVNVGTGGMTANRLGILDRRTGKATRTDRPCTTVLGVIDGRVVCVAPTGTVTVAAIDAEGTLGPSQLVLEDVLVRPGGAAKAALSAGGTLIYHRGTSVSRLVVTDERGVSTGLNVEPRAFSHPRWSPDGTRIAVTVARSGGTDVWIVDVRSGAWRRLTPTDGSADQPEWSADGKRIVFRYLQLPSGGTIRWMAVDGSARPELLLEGAALPLESAADLYSPTLTPDNRFVVLGVVSGDPVNGGDVMFAPVDRSVKLQFVAELPGHDYTPSVSPDNRWVVYTNAYSGRPEVYVRPFPGPGVAVQVSRDGGAEPVWSSDGRTIFFRRVRTVMAARVSLGATATVSGVSELFTGDYLIDPGYGNFDAAPGGRRFVQLENVDRQEETVLIYNWAAELRRSWR